MKSLDFIAKQSNKAAKTIREISKGIRVLVLPEPHAEAISKGEETLIVKAKPFCIADDPIYIGDSARIYGIVTLTKARPISTAEFRRRNAEHGISEEERKRMWPQARRLYAWKVKKTEALKSPQAWNCPNESQNIVEQPQLVEEEVVKYEEPKGALPTLKMPNPKFNINRLKQGKSSGVLSRLQRKGRIGEAQFLINEIASIKADAAYIWGVVSLEEPIKYPSVAEIPKAILDGIDTYSREEYSTVKPIFYMPMKLLAEYSEPKKLKSPPKGRRYGSEIELPDALAKQEILSVDVASPYPQQATGPWVSFSDINPTMLKDMDDDEILFLYSLGNTLLDEAFSDDAMEYQGLGKEDLVNALTFLKDEIESRGLIAKAGPTNKYAPINPGSIGEHPPLGLDDFLPNVHQEFLIRSPLVYLVGSLANNGVTKNDIDMIIRGPLDPTTEHIIKFRIGRMMPPDISNRLSFHSHDGDENTIGSSCGPFTAHIPLYDLVVRRRDDFKTVIEMQESLDDLSEELVYVAQEEAMQGPISKADLPRVERPYPSVLQAHFRGESVHGDLRIKQNGYLEGFTLAFQKAGKVPTPKDLTDAKRITGSFSMKGSYWNKPMIAPSRIYATDKAPEPISWMDINAQEFKPGQVGATRFKKGYIVSIARPNISIGETQSYFHEFFLENDPKFCGLFVLRLLVSEEGLPSDPEVEAGRQAPKGVPFWTAMFTKSLIPSVLKPRAVKVGRIPPQGWAFLPPGLKSVVPTRFRYWRPSDEKERREIRDELVKDGFFNDDNIKLVNCKFTRVVKKYYAYVPPKEDLEDNTYAQPTHTAFQHTNEIKVCKEENEGIDAVFEKYHTAVNMPYADMLEWSKDPCAILGSLDQTPIDLNLRLMKLEKADWTPQDAADAEKVVSAITKLRAIDSCGPAADECPSRRDIALLNWGFNPLEVQKALKEFPFTLSWQRWKGQEVIRAAPSRQIFHLFVEREKGHVEDYQLLDDPAQNAQVAVVLDSSKDSEASKLLELQGDIAPDKEILGLKLNPTKDTPSIMRILASGMISFYEDSMTFKKFELKGKDIPAFMKGPLILRAEEARPNSVWIFERSAAAGQEISKRAETKDVTLEDGKVLHDVQIWNPSNISSGDNKTHDREALRPFALYAPMKVAPRKQNEFRGNEIERVFSDFATEEMLKVGIAVQAKYNGFRISLQQNGSGENLIITEDLWDRKTPIRDYSDSLPGLIEELNMLEGPFILDGEFMAVSDEGSPIPRRELAEYRGLSPETDKNVRVQLFDILYHPTEGNVVAKPLSERLDLLKKFIGSKKLTRLQLAPTTVAHSKDELLKAYDWATKIPGSEGAMLKSVESTVTLRETDSMAKIKGIREIRGIIWDRHAVKGSPGVHNFYYAVGPVSQEEAKKWAEPVEIKGKVYIKTGRTFNKLLDADVGDVIRIEVTEMLLDISNPDSKRLRGFTPVVIDVTDQKPSTLKEIQNELGTSELKKGFCEYYKEVRIVKQEAQEERFVLGVVLVPEEFDSQGDIYSEEEVRKAAHFFMEDLSAQKIGENHDKTLKAQQVKILETYIAPIDMNVEGEVIKKGTWLLAARILDDDLWAKVKEGKLTGWSIEGSAMFSYLD